MQLGMDLYTRYKDKIEKLTYQIILDELEMNGYNWTIKIITQMF